MMLLGVLAQRVLAAVVNLLTNGDFAQEGAGWAAYSRSSGGDEGTATSFTAFADGACQLTNSGGFRGSNFGGIRRDLDQLTVVGAIYRVTFDYSGALAGEPQSRLRIGGVARLLNLPAASGSYSADITASNATAVFALDVSGVANGPPAVVDNIRVTKL